MYTERKTDIHGVPLHFSKVVWFNFGMGELVHNGQVVQERHSSEVWVRYSYDIAETPRRVNFYKKSNFRLLVESVPPPLYDSYPLPIKAEKAADLKKTSIIVSAQWSKRHVHESGCRYQ